MNLKNDVGAFAALLALGLLGCGSADALDQPFDSADDGSARTPRWAYEGVDGPEHWGELSEDYAACGSGEHQSPIDIPTSVAAAPLAGLAFDYAATAANVVDEGNTVRVNLDRTNQLTLAGKDYSLLGFHFHAHSEHTVGGEASPLEMHLVHASADRELAVLAVFFEMGADNAALAPVFDAMSPTMEPLDDLPTDINPATLLPASDAGWVYSGSLTTPPCTEGVKWHVYSEPLPISEAQLSAFTELHAQSSRPTMSNASAVSGGN